MKDKILTNIENNCSLTDNIYEAIYIIDGKMVDGEFDYGIRGLDHNALIDDDYDWIDLLENGIVIVPETETYISNESYEDLELIGYTRLDLDDNHIIRK